MNENPLSQMSIDELDVDAYEALLEPIWYYLCVYDEPEIVDIIFVFGGMDISVPIRAKELFLMEYSKLILITGNAGPKTPTSFNKPEALIFKDKIISLGIDENKIIIEEKATNTLENVLFGMKILQMNHVVCDKAILVARPFLLRRCQATFNQQFPSVKVICCPPKGRIIEFCFQSKRKFAERLLDEITRLKSYSIKGDIIILSIPDNVLSACDRLEQILRNS